jgi:hypothetical protein
MDNLITAAGKGNFFWTFFQGELINGGRKAFENSFSGIIF